MSVQSANAVSYDVEPTSWSELEGALLSLEGLPVEADVGTPQLAIP